MGNLSGKVIFVTGASSGIGHASSKVLADHGASVVIASRREEESLQLVDELRGAGANVAPRGPWGVSPEALQGYRLCSAMVKSKGEGSRRCPAR